MKKTMISRSFTRKKCLLLEEKAIQVPPCCLISACLLNSACLLKKDLRVVIPSNQFYEKGNVVHYKPESREKNKEYLKYSAILHSKLE